MPKLSLIQSEAERLLRRMPEAARHSLQQAVVDLCETHWDEIRGPEPTAPLAHALWSATPPCADLLADLVATNDVRLQDLLGPTPAHGFALLALAEIARGNAEGARLAHAPMMLFATPAAGARYAESVAAVLRGAAMPPAPRPHTGKPPLWKALACIVAQTGRCDLAAALRVVGLLAAPESGADPEIETLRRALDATGVRFLGIDDDHVSLALHGHPHAPVSTRQLGEMLGEIRQAWLG